MISLKPAALSSSSKSLASPRGSLRAGGGPVGCCFLSSFDLNMEEDGTHGLGLLM